MINSIAFRPISFEPSFSIPTFPEIKARVQQAVSKAIPSTVLPDAINKIFNGCMAGGWGVLGGIGALSLFSNISDLWQAIKLDPSDPQKARKIASYAKKTFIDSMFIGGIVTNALEWAHSINWISLGGLAPAFKAAGFGSSAMR